MTRTYERPLILWLLLATISARAQSLEEKLSQTRAQRLDDLRIVDSAMSERSRAGKMSSSERLRGDRAVRSIEEADSDSLLSGPMETDTLLDSADYAAFRKSKLREKKQPIKRYEQRIFRNVDRSVFSAATGAAGREYVLGPGDEVTVALWGDKEREYHLTLNKDGKVFLEGVGLVTMAGFNLNEAQEKLKDRLSKIYSGIPRGTTKVEVSLGKAGPIRVFVLGEVKSPGGYVFSGNTSVLTAMYYAQGPSDIGSVRSLQLTRSGKKYTLDLYRYLIYGESLVPNALQDGDILFSGRAEALVDVQGEVGRPAVYELKKGEGVKEVLEFAGGINPSAATHKLSLQRIFEGGKPDYKDLPKPHDFLSGKEKVELQDGDKLLVKRSTDSSENYLNITGPVRYPGTYEATGVSNVDELVKKAGGLREDAFLGRVHVLRLKADGSSSLTAYSLDRTITDSIQVRPRDHIILYSLKEMYLPDSVEVHGAVFNPGKYEFRDGMSAMDLVMQAGGYLPHHERGKLLVFRGGTREKKVDQITLKVEDGLAKSDAGFRLKPTDLVHVPVDPLFYRKEVVTLEGLFQHPGKYSLLYPGEKLAAVIERAGGLQENAYVEGTRFIRSKDSVGKVGVSVREALSNQRSRANIHMVGGDSIYVPGRLSTVKVIGEVGYETSVLFREGAGVQYYVEQAGGFTRRSERDRIVVQYANGETSRDGYFNRKPDAGSTILVPQGPEPKAIDWLGGINAILGTLSIGLAVILSIQAIKN